MINHLHSSAVVRHAAAGTVAGRPMKSYRYAKSNEST